MHTHTLYNENIMHTHTQSCAADTHLWPLAPLWGKASEKRISLQTSTKVSHLFEPFHLLVPSHSLACSRSTNSPSLQADFRYYCKRDILPTAVKKEKKTWRLNVNFWITFFFMHLFKFPNPLHTGSPDRPAGLINASAMIRSLSEFPSVLIEFCIFHYFVLLWNFQFTLEWIHLHICTTASSLVKMTKTKAEKKKKQLYIFIYLSMFVDNIVSINFFLESSFIFISVNSNVGPSF